MAFSLKISYIHVLFLAFLTTFFPHPTKGDLIDDVCADMPDQRPLCLDTLRSDPRSRTQNLPVLAQISIDAALKDATGLPSFVQTQQLKAKDPGVRGRISGCVTNADNALASIKDAKQMVDSKRFGPAHESARWANGTLSVCEQSFMLPRAVEPVELKQAMDRLEGLVSVFIVVTNHMV